MRRKGFTLIELLVVIAIIALLISILLPALGEAKKAGRLAVCISNIRGLGQATQTYSSEFKEMMPSFTWEAGKTYVDPSDPNGAGLGNAGNDWIASNNQLAYIIRFRGDRPGMPPATNLFPHLTYTHLVMQDYMAQKLPDATVVCPEDANRKLWNKDPKGYDQGLYQPNFGTSIGASDLWRHPYGASYRVVPAFIDRSPTPYRVMYTPTGGTITIYPTLSQYGKRKISDVSQPSLKVAMHDTFGRHFGKIDYRQWIGTEFSKQPLLFFDNSVVNRSNDKCNYGFDPNGNQATAVNSPNSSPPMPPPTAPYYTIQYAASAIEPPAPVTVNGRPYFLSTRGGLRGVDFGGTDVRSNGY
ncbi:MAG: type II secretion system protein [Phycisphaerales bacterium]